MAETIYKRAYVAVDSVNISSYVIETRATLDNRVMHKHTKLGDVTERERNLMDGIERMTIIGFQDLDSATGPRKAFEKFWTSAGLVQLVFRGIDANPNTPTTNWWVQTCAIVAYDPASGTHGEKVKFTAELVAAAAMSYQPFLP